MKTRRAFAAAAALVVVTGLGWPAGAQGASADDGSTTSGTEASSDAPPDVDPTLERSVGAHAAAVPEGDRGRVLGGGWAESEDRAWSTVGDGDGFHVLVADAADGYAWRTLATLTEPGFDTDRWVGNACVTGSGERLVVAYGPRSFTNDPDVFRRGAFTATVDLTSGAVERLDVRGTLEYFSPACGRDETAVVTQSGGAHLDATRLVTVDAEAARVVDTVEVPGQVTSAVPTPEGLVAAAGAAVVRIEDDGTPTPLGRAAAAPFRLTLAADGALVYLDHDGETSTVRRLTADRLRRPRPDVAVPALASGPLTGVGITSTARGDVLVTGSARRAVLRLPSGVALVGGDKDATASVLGEVLVRTTGVVTGSERAAAVAAGAEPGTLVDLSVTSVATGRSADLSAVVGDGTPEAVADVPLEGLRAGPGMSAPAGPVRADDPVSIDRTCAVPRNDPRSQAMQPKPRQVEWVVNRAVHGRLDVLRPANWKNLGMPAYRPQELFPPVPLLGGGTVPPQVMLGILAQESNLWQAPGHVVPGVTGDPLIGNYYGLDRSAEGDAAWVIDWSEADCGYGVAQVTDGMRRNLGSGGTYSNSQQRAIALDFAANVAAGLAILQEKWNQTRAAGLVVNDGNPARIENWFFAVWAYNSGFYPEEHSNILSRNGAWGVGWANNPANPSYDPSRKPFHENPADAKDPQKWPYPEKVMGFAAHPPSLLEAPETFVPAFRPATWPGGDEKGPVNRSDVKPPVFLFCDETNNCLPQPVRGVFLGADGYDWGSCYHRAPDGSFNGHCWYHEPVTWKPDCQNTCGRGFQRFPDDWPYEPDGNAYPPQCTRNGLPAGALVVDDVPEDTPIVREGCTLPSWQAGTFELRFARDAHGGQPGRIDLHQLGAGYGGHFWFTHTRNRWLRDGTMRITGTWTLGQELHQWTRVLVHVPDHGAHTPQATYVVDRGWGQPVARTILQRTMRNGWVSLGVFDVRGTPSVTLSSETRGGDGPAGPGGGDPVQPLKNEDIAWDAVAFVPLDKKPEHLVVALGDSYSSGEGAGDYYAETDNNGSKPRLLNACHRSPWTWSRQASIPGLTDEGGAPVAMIGHGADHLVPDLDYHLLACSGAVTGNVSRGGTGQYGELSQIDRGFLDENTTLVTISIGGNDAGFSTVLTACTAETPLAGDACQDLEDDTGRTLSHRVNGWIDAAGSRVEGVLGEIHAEAPNAHVVLMGYPEVVSGTCVVGLYEPEVRWLAGVAFRLAARMAHAVDVANAAAGEEFAAFIDPRDAFAGAGVCGSPEDIHGIVLAKTPGEPAKIGQPGWSPVSYQSFHPKVGGYRRYADLLTAHLEERRAGG